MVIYFDESYDSEHKYLILGALFNPHPKFLHKQLLEKKKEFGFIDSAGKTLEIKYNSCTKQEDYDMCCSAVDIFIRSTSYFRSIVIDQAILDLNYFGKKHEPKRIKMARAYKKFAELLISHNSENIYNGVLLTDELSRCKGDEFIEIMKKDFCLPNGKYCNAKDRPTLKHIADIHSDVESYQVNQINDILIGCILNNNVPTKNRFKNQLREHLINRLEVDSLLSNFWNKYSKSHVEKNYPKYNIWYWQPKPIKKPLLGEEVL